MKVTDNFRFSQLNFLTQKSSVKSSTFHRKILFILLVIFVSCVFLGVPALADSDCGACSVDSGSSGSDSGSSDSSAVVLIGKAKTEEKLGNMNTSLMLYENATKADPYYITAWIGYSDALKSAGNLTGSLEAIDKAIKLRSGDADLYTKRGDLFAGLGNATLANEAYKKAESMNPNIPGIREKIANLSLISIKADIATTVAQTNVTKVATREQSNFTTANQPVSEKVTSTQVPTTVKSPGSALTMVLSIIGCCSILIFMRKRE